MSLISRRMRSSLWRSLASLRSRSLSCSVSSGGVGSARSRVAPRVAGAPCAGLVRTGPEGRSAAAPCPGRGPFASTDPERPAVRRVRSGACRPAIGSGGVGTGAAGPDGVCVADGLAEGAEPPEVVPDDEPVWARAENGKVSMQATMAARMDGSSRFERTVVKYHEGKVYANSAAPPDGRRVPPFVDQLGRTMQLPPPRVCARIRIALPFSSAPGREPGRTRGSHGCAVGCR